MWFSWSVSLILAPFLTSEMGSLSPFCSTSLNPSVGRAWMHFDQQPLLLRSDLCVLSHEAMGISDVLFLGSHGMSG